MRWGLRTRLVLLVLAVVVPAAIAHVVSRAIDRGIQEQIAELRRESLRPLDEAGVVGSSLELEGEWDARGFFAVRSIESLARQRRPKLRGAIQAVADDGSFSMYGVPIRVGPATELPPGRSAADGAWAPEVGARVEVSCAVDHDGRWFARKIRSDYLKSSDKLKGTITRATRHVEGGLLLEISGLQAVTRGDAQVAVARGPVHRMEIAAQMTRALEECLTAAQDMLRIRHVRKVTTARGEVEGAARITADLADAEDRLLDAAAEFAHLLADSRASVDDTSSPRGPGRARLGRAIEPLERMHEDFARDVQRALEVAAADLDAAQAFVEDTLEPQIRHEIQPHVQALQIGAEEELSDELASIGARSASAARMSLLTGACGFFLAIAVGLFAARSVSRPVVELEAAACRIGAGDLDARVEVRSRDELGALATSFNRMAEHLAASTVSVSHLNGVIDSLAGALFLLGPDGAITSVNPAALALLGYGPGELVGVPFATVCSGGAGEEALRTAAAHDLTSGEHVFKRRDGTTIPVSFSGAALRGDGRAVRGFVCLAEDLTERKRMEEALRRSLGDKELLLRELHHRVKNNLQMISSLLDLQSREVADPKSLEKFRDSQDRIRSLVLIHEQLYRARDLTAVDMRVYLGLLAANLEQAHVDPPGRVRVRAEVDEVRLDLDRALACGLIVNELVTNAIKHAFPAGSAGAVAVTLEMAGTRLRLRVLDDGQGVGASRVPNADQLGMQLIRALCSQLDGEITVAARAGEGIQGTECRIEFPVTPAPAEVV